MKNNNTIPTLSLVFATLIWASTFAIVKDTMSSVDVFFINFSRSAIAAIPLLVASLIFNKKALFQKNNFIKGSKIGIILALTYAFQNYGMLYTSSANTAFIMSSSVIFVPLILFFFYKHAINGKSIISIAIVSAGLFFLSYEKGLGFNFGDLIILFGAVITAMHIIMTGRYVKKHDLMALLTYQFLSSAVISFAINYAISPESIKIDYPSESWLSLMYLGIFGSLVCYFIAVWSQKYLNYITVTLIYSLEPVFAAVFAYFILNEVLRNEKILGAILIVFGVIIFEIPFRKFKFFK